MRKHIVIFGVLLLAWALPGSAQADRPLQIRLSVSSKSVLVGEPAILSLRIENTSGKDLVLPARPAWHMLRFGGLVFFERPATETSNGYEGGPTAGNPVPVYASKEKMAPGEILVLPPLEIRNGNAGPCRVIYRFDSREVLPEINLKTRAIEPNEDVWRGVTESEEVAWQVKEPQGEDLLAMQAYQRAIPNALRGWILEEWASELLSRFPTSTYAGYVLVKLGGGMSLQEASKVTPEVRDQVWYVPTGASLEKQEEHRRMVWKNYEEYVRQAQTFLAAHPDFSQRALLRKQLAIHLFYLDRTQEAWAEVEALSKLDGPWAEEAKSLLECKGVSGENVGAR